MDTLTVNSRLRYQKNTWLHIKRQLPANKRKINVTVHQELQPADILGEGQTPIGYRVIHLAKELGTDPKSAMNCLRRKIGQYIYKGELIAQYHSMLGLSNKLFISKFDGIIDDYNLTSGDLRIKLIPKNSQVMSGVYGIVEKIDEAASLVIIKTVATIIYGVLGIGKEREGILEVLDSADALISARQIPEDIKGKILVGGGIIFADALEEVRNGGAMGIITGGMNAGDYKTMVGGRWNIVHKQWTDVGLTLMITEGFGACPIGEDLMALLQGHDSKFAILDGYQSRLILPSQDRNCMMYLRRVNLPSEPTLDNVDRIGDIALKVGSQVRIISQPNLGVQGQLVAIDRTATKLASGITTYLVTVNTRLTKLRIPYTNVEVIA